MELTVHDLACRRAGRRVLAGVSFTVGPSEALVVTGRNGAGKSTLLAALAGLLRPEAGSIRASGLGERTLAESL
ncbi:MAG TPA: ATP-binding cassette domain-containing protein, partial [Enterovirga sp.]